MTDQPKEATPETLEALADLLERPTKDGARLVREGIRAHADAWELLIDAVDEWDEEIEDNDSRPMSSRLVLQQLAIAALRARLLEVEQGAKERIEELERDLLKWEGVYGKWPGDRALNVTALRRLVEEETE